jgi:hypothetical protein
MAKAITNEQRGIGVPSRAVNRPERTTPNPATADRGNGQVLSQEASYAARVGPLMKMLQTMQRADQVERSKQLEQKFDQLEERFAKRLREFEDIEARRAPYEVERRALRGSNMGAQAALALHLKNEQTRRKKGHNIGFGIEWLRQKAVGQKDVKPTLFYERWKAEFEKRDIYEMSCLTVMASSLPWYAAGYDGEEYGQTYEAVDFAIAKAADARGPGAQVRASRVTGGRGTVVLEELRKQLQFETIHVDAVPATPTHDKNYTSDAETRKSGWVPNKPAIVKGADPPHTLIEVRVKIDRFVKLGKKPSPESAALWAEIKKVPFAVGVADSGYHTFAIASGQVIEVHWDRGPQDYGLTSAKPIESLFKNFGSLVIAVPPKILKPPPGQLRR